MATDFSHAMSRRPPTAWARITLAALACFCIPAFAASLQVAPTLVELAASERGEAVWLTNTAADTPTRAQVRLFRWTQKNGEDILEPTSDLAISPPLTELAGGAQQLVRVIRTGPPPTGAEASYRIIVDEVPRAESSDQTGLNFLLRYSIPVFVLPVTEAPIGYDLAPRLESTGEQVMLVVTNRGLQHAQIADLSYVDRSGARHELMSGLVGYVLPGQTMRWSLPSAGRDYSGGSFKARINGEAVEQTLKLHPASG
ncbi:fimbrial biogenesis chaperone [Novilysobacter luteus]|uniref:Pili assembly chaperone N-terminal domain-containing protein n=1 Tax=Novilysobacter luteus TaxID=2822368 RepID=A0ABM8UGF8_9GAMM|nr:molecular chaperone [Lysobacter luteus]CAG4974709.1 hypothetical protein LYB30171_01733 [Lysobacter luteus]